MVVTLANVRIILQEFALSAQFINDIKAALTTTINTKTKQSDQDCIQ